MTAERRPNFLVICADQLKAGLLGCYGNPAISTPNIDALAAEGTTFTEATVANPTCMPNRAAMLTGRWPSVHGTRHNGIPLDPHANTFPRQLREAGYRTAAVGKMHLQNMGFWFSPAEEAEIRAVDPLTLDPEAKDAASRPWTADRDFYENRERFSTEDAQSPDDYYGFAEVDFVVGHGDTTTGNYRWWAMQRGVDPEAIGGQANARIVSATWEHVATPDLAPTLIEWAGARPYRGIQGRSIAGLAAGSAGDGAAPASADDEHRDAVLVEEDQPYGTPGLPAPVRMRTLLTREARLTRYVGTDFTELYALGEDPLELTNVAESPDHAALLHRMTARMAEELAALAETGIAPTASA